MKGVKLHLTYFMHPITSPALIQYFMKHTDSELLLSVFVIFSLLLIDEERLS